MTTLLDTHTFLWAITDDPRLPSAHREIFLDEHNDLYLSVASVWEIVIKSGLGKLLLPRPTAQYVFKQMEKNRVRSLTIQPSHLSELESLPPLHRDPFDRMLVAQARAEKIPILSTDAMLKNYGVALW